MSGNVSETEGIQVLLEEIQRTISDNKQFLKRLKSDDADLEMAEELPMGTDDPEDGFEEL
jgi:hypothetical protein